MRIKTRSMMSVSLRMGRTGNHLKGDVLCVPPIVTCPSLLFPDQFYILNGKHRALIALVRGVSLREVIVNKRSDLIHHLPRECMGGQDTPEQLLKHFDDRAQREIDAQRSGIINVKDLLDYNREIIM